jgi:hypothetical protein
MHTDSHGRPAAADTGCVAHLSAGGWGRYHRMDCAEAPRRGDVGVRDVIHGPWRYLSSHWAPCSLCLPPTAADLPAHGSALPTAA